MIVKRVSASKGSMELGAATFMAAMVEEEEAEGSENRGRRRRRSRECGKKQSIAGLWSGIWESGQFKEELLDWFMVSFRMAICEGEDVIEVIQMLILIGNFKIKQREAHVFQLFGHIIFHIYSCFIIKTSQNTIRKSLKS